MASCKYLDRIELTYVPLPAVDYVKSIGGREVNSGDVVYEIPMKGNPRNVRGYRSKLDSDVRKLRSYGCVIREVYNEAGIAWKAKLDAKNGTQTTGNVGPDTQGHGKAASKPKLSTG